MIVEMLDLRTGLVYRTEVTPQRLAPASMMARSRRRGARFTAPLASTV